MTRLPTELGRSIARKEPVLWLNPKWQSMEAACPTLSLNLTDVQEAGQQLERYAPLLEFLFPELVRSRGIIESALVRVERFQGAMLREQALKGRWMIKGDHNLPVVGSIKARGGFYEVLTHAEALALSAGLISDRDDRRRLASAEARSFFAQHEVAVGSTGNLGLSIGVMASALGFSASVHMSREAKAWKKEKLRARGVTVIEHDGDFGEAVAAGRAQARENPRAYFVDDEHSRTLFLGYSVAALRLKPQLAAAGVTVDSRHPLFVYLPCGVGGAPGGIAFGLRHIFGDHVHCFFAEPVASPGMLIRLASTVDLPVSVRELGLDNRTEADGLAVAQVSEFVAPLIRTLVSGVFTVTDDDLFEDLYRLELSDGMRIEPSAAAGFRGPQWLLGSPAGWAYLEQHGLAKSIEEATHLLWTTGGAFVPDAEYRRFHARGQRIVSRGPST